MEGWQGLALKPEHQWDMMMKVCDCTVTPMGRAMGEFQRRTVMKGLLMELETPSDVIMIVAPEKPGLKRENDSVCL